MIMSTELFEYIAVQPGVRFGKPVIRGTRVPVDMIVGKIAGGMSVEEVMREYELARLQVLAALQYAAQLVSEETLAFA